MAVVATKSGSIRGTETDHSLVFRGIPFAMPPVGRRRFLPPEEHPPWSGVRDATRFGPPALQNSDRLESIWGEVLAPGSEDCLTLNVWTPGLDAPLRPVMVWIHGGAFIIGSGRWGWYEGSRLARRGDVVVVTFNYRLGALGFLDLGPLGGPDYAQSRNCGLLDQIAALRWVKENIAGFGGDPDRITILGESAGATSVSCLMACPRAQGLFHRAICMSGAPGMVRAPEVAARTAERFLQSARVSGIEDLLDLPAEAILEAQDQLVRKPEYLGEMPFGPAVDGDLLPEPPLHAIERGKAGHIPLLTGTTRDELRLWILYSPRLRQLDPRCLARWMHAIGLSPRTVLATYRDVHPGTTPGERTLAIGGDLLFRLPQIRLAEAQGRHRADTRMYLFAWKTPVHRGWLGSPHAVDVPFLFGNLDARGVAGMIGTGPGHRALSDAVQDAWVSFARDGDPNHAGLPEWPPYETIWRTTLVFDSAPRTADDPEGATRRLWDHLPFDGLRPSVADLPRIGDIARFYRNRLSILVASTCALLFFFVITLIYYMKY